MTIIDTTLTIGSIVVTGNPIDIGASGYELIDMGLDTMSRRRDVATSPWVDGETELASVRGAQTYTFTIIANAPTMGAAIALVDAVKAQVEQKEWALTEEVESHSVTYDCRAAASIESRYERTYFINHRRSITVTVPVKRAP